MPLELKKFLVYPSPITLKRDPFAKPWIDVHALLQHIYPLAPKIEGFETWCRQPLIQPDTDPYLHGVPYSYWDLWWMNPGHYRSFLGVLVPQHDLYLQAETTRSLALAVLITQALEEEQVKDLSAMTGDNYLSLYPTHGLLCELKRITWWKPFRLGFKVHSIIG